MAHAAVEAEGSSATNAEASVSTRRASIKDQVSGVLKSPVKYLSKSKQEGAPAPTVASRDVRPSAGAVKICTVAGGSLESLLGEVAMFTETGSQLHQRTATVLARDQCELYCISGSAFALLCKNYPAARIALIRLAKRRLERTDKLREEHAAQHGAPTHAAPVALPPVSPGGRSPAQAGFGPASPGNVSTRLQSLERGQARMEAQLERLTELLTAGAAPAPAKG